LVERQKRMRPQKVGLVDLGDPSDQLEGSWTRCPSAGSCSVGIQRRKRRRAAWHAVELRKPTEIAADQFIRKQCRLVPQRASDLRTGLAGRTEFAGR